MSVTTCIPTRAASLPGQADRSSRVLIVLDDAAAVALPAGVTIVMDDGADLALLSTVDTRQATHDPTVGRRAARARLLHATLSLPADLHPAEFVREGLPAQIIAQAAHDWAADLVVVGVTMSPSDIDGDALARATDCRILLVQEASQTVRMPRSSVR